MERYRKINHDIIFEDWWACKNCKAKGPTLNKRNCTQFTENKSNDDLDDSGMNTKRERRTTMIRTRKNIMKETTMTQTTVLRSINRRGKERNIVKR
eukprot:1856561-Heterocapsa_arctica.AAC.1